MTTSADRFLKTKGIPDKFLWGKKHDDGKTRYDLIPPDALEDVARVFTFGAKKYGERNWEKGIAFGRCFAAAMRHLWSWWRGEENDPETGLPHLAHAAVNVMFLLAFVKRKAKQLDDRSKAA